MPVALALEKAKRFNDAITRLADHEDTPIDKLEGANAATSASAGPSGEEDQFGEQGEGDPSAAPGEAKE
ncbi:hypothetical protein BDZ91DRAFT_789130 [Kalaharituber pfeilii]|nr:hypothetical protein BDZ91DRAFT_789130 [Kalaharituber pfeilii]